MGLDASLAGGNLPMAAWALPGRASTGLNGPRRRAARFSTQLLAMSPVPGSPRSGAECLFPRCRRPQALLARIRPEFPLLRLRKQKLESQRLSIRQHGPKARRLGQRLFRHLLQTDGLLQHRLDAKRFGIVVRRLAAFERRQSFGRIARAKLRNAKRR